jgi:hypothetical protein
MTSAQLCLHSFSGERYRDETSTSYLDCVHFQRKTGSVEEPIKHRAREQSKIRLARGCCHDLLFPDQPSQGGQESIIGTNTTFEAFPAKWEEI